MTAVRGILVRAFGGPDVLRLVNDIPRPKPSPTQLLIKVKAAGVNPVDTYIRTGLHQLKPDLPYTPGSDGAGIVDSIGEQVTKFKVGDRVYWCRSVDGSYKEFTLTEEKFTFPLDSSLSFQQGASLGIPYFTAYRALVTKAQVQAGETVLVHGASGAVGIACCQIAHHLGATVIGTAGTELGMRIVLENGANSVLNHKQPGYTDQLQRNGGVNVIVEMLANVNLEKDMELSGLNSRIAIVGCRGKTELSPRMAMVNETVIHGVMLFRANDSDWIEMGEFMTKGQKEGWIRPIVGLEFPLDQADAAHVEVLEHKTATTGKIVLTI